MADLEAAKRSLAAYQGHVTRKLSNAEALIQEMMGDDVSQLAEAEALITSATDQLGKLQVQVEEFEITYANTDGEQVKKRMQKVSDAKNQIGKLIQGRKQLADKKANATVHIHDQSTSSPNVEKKDLPIVGQATEEEEKSRPDSIASRCTRDTPHTSSNMKTAGQGKPVMECVRKPVTNKRPQVWELRCDMDLFTRQKKEVVERKRPQVDHILEIQMLDKVWKGAPVVARTRKAHAQFCEVVNDVPALNVTPLKVNSVKKGAVYAFLNRAHATRLRTKSLEECFTPEWRDNGICANISQSIVETYDDFVASRVPQVVTNQALVDALLDGITDFIGKMDIQK